MRIFNTSSSYSLTWNGSWRKNIHKGVYFQNFLSRSCQASLSAILFLFFRLSPGPNFHQPAIKSNFSIRLYILYKYAIKFFFVIIHPIYIRITHVSNPNNNFFIHPWALENCEFEWILADMAFVLIPKRVWNEIRFSCHRNKYFMDIFDRYSQWKCQLDHFWRF